MLSVFLIILLMETSWICKAQNFKSLYVDLLKKELRVLPYKDFTLSYTLSYDSLQKRYIFQAPQLYMDSVANVRLLRKMNELPRATTTSYGGTINFDNYTDHIFISSEAEGADKIFVTMEVLTEPRGGIKRFIQRWGDYLDSLKTIGEFDETGVPSESYVSLHVNVDGSLVSRDTSKIGILLRQFIQKEPPWTPGIMSGQPVLQLVEMQVPSSKWNYGALNYRRYSGLEKRIYIRGRETIVCYSAVIPKLNGVRTLLSAVYDQGSYVAPVFHKGPLDELQELREFLDKGQVKATYRPYAHRIYFYTLEK